MSKQWSFSYWKGFDRRSHRNAHGNILTSTLKPLTGRQQLPWSLHLWRLRTGSPWCVVITSCIAPCRVNKKEIHGLYQRRFCQASILPILPPPFPCPQTHARPRPPEKPQNNVLWVARNESHAKHLEILEHPSWRLGFPQQMEQMGSIDFTMFLIQWKWWKYAEIGKYKIRHFCSYRGLKSQKTSFSHKKCLQVWNISRCVDIKQHLAHIAWLPLPYHRATCSQGAIRVCPQRNGSGKIVNRDPRSLQLKHPVRTWWTSTVLLPCFNFDFCWFTHDVYLCTTALLRLSKPAV